MKMTLLYTCRLSSSLIELHSDGKAHGNPSNLARKRPPASDAKDNKIIMVHFSALHTDGRPLSSLICACNINQWPHYPQNPFISYLARVWVVRFVGAVNATTVTIVRSPNERRSPRCWKRQMSYGSACGRVRIMWFYLSGSRRMGGRGRQ